jgi:hypothetical protein
MPRAVTLRDEIEAFLLTLPSYLIEPEAMTEILELLHAPEREAPKAPETENSPD